MPTYTKQGSFGWAGGGKSGAVVDLWAQSRFGGFPAQNQAPPAGEPDAGPVTTGTAFGNPGAYLITDIPSIQEYYVRVQYGGETYWGDCPAGTITGQGTAPVEQYLSFVTDFGADPTGSEDVSGVLKTAVSESAAANMGLWIPSGQYLYDASADVTLSAGQTVNIAGAGRETTQFFAADGFNGFFLRTHYANAWMRDFWVNKNGGTGAGILADNAYLGQIDGSTQSITADTSSNNRLVILSARPTGSLAALLVPGNPITVDQQTNGLSTPAYSGTIASWDGDVTITVNTNTNYPNGAVYGVTNQDWRVGSGSNTVSEWTFERIGLSNAAENAEWGLIGHETSQCYPFTVGNFTCRDILIQDWASGGSSGQECVTWAGIQHADVRRVVMDNSSPVAADYAPRGPIGAFSYDYSYVSGIVFLAGEGGMTDVSTVNINYGGQSVIDIDGLYVSCPNAANGGPLYLGALQANVSKLTLPAGCPVDIGGIGGTFFAAGPGTTSFSHTTALGGVNIQTPQTQVNMDATVHVAAPSSRGCVSFSPSSWSGGDGGTFVINGATLDLTSEGSHVFYTAGSVDATIVWEGGQALNLPNPAHLTSSGVSLQTGTQFTGVGGLNPVGGTALSTAFSMPLTTAGWTNQSGNVVMLFLTAGSLSACKLGSVSVSTTGPWRVLVGETWTPTYTSATVTPYYE